MITEDKLSREERIRLESVNQANVGKGAMSPSEVHQLLHYAQQIEAFIIKGTLPPSKVKGDLTLIKSEDA